MLTQMEQGILQRFHYQTFQRWVLRRQRHVVQS